ncbi:MAG: Hpt domain-containing protein, partial [Planctomycetota bacterium]
MEGLDEIVEEFLVESYESLDQLDSDLVALEETPEDLDRLASIFRTVHTIKGTSGFLALPKLERVAHVGENLLVPLRDGDLKLTEDIASGLLGMVDAIRDMLGSLEKGGDEGGEDYEPLVARLQDLLSGEPEEAAEPDAPSAEPSEPESGVKVQIITVTEEAPPAATTDTMTEAADVSGEDTPPNANAEPEAGSLPAPAITESVNGESTADASTPSDAQTPETPTACEVVTQTSTTATETAAETNGEADASARETGA